jgi:ferric-dicitrate binding protein FerR (iron transport regulator)
MVSEDLIVKYLAGEAEEHEILLLEKWRKESSENEKLFEDLKMLWEKSKALKNVQKVDVEAAWQRVSGKIQEGKVKVIPFRRYWAIAASIAFLIGISLFFISKNDVQQSESFAIVSEDSIIQKTLKDGSIVTLKTGELAYNSDFNVTNRAINFKKGTAYFKIKKDSLHPFTIDCNGATIKVLGTEFEISTDPKMTTVRVKEGKVKFSSAKGELILTKGMGAEYSSNNKEMHQIEGKQAHQFTYATHKIEFDNVPIQEAIKDLNAAYPKHHFELKDVDVNCKISSSFNITEKPEDIGFILSKTIGADFVIENDKIIISGGKCQ